MSIQGVAEVHKLVYTVCKWQSLSFNTYTGFTHENVNEQEMIVQEKYSEKPKYYSILQL